MLRGVIERFEKGKIFGWAHNFESPSEHLKVVVRSDDGVVAEGVANKFRKDLPAAGLGDGHHAFEIAVPTNMTSLPGLRITAESENGDTIVMVIETEQDRRMHQALATFSGQYDEAFTRLMQHVEESGARVKNVEQEVATRLSEFSKRVDEWEERMEANEVFMVRIDETLTSLLAEQGKRRRKRFFGLF